jgi:hypothetical protein
MEVISSNEQGVNEQIVVFVIIITNNFAKFIPKLNITAFYYNY